jgi:hypothetical protein
MPKNKPTKSPKKHYWYLFNVKPGLMCIRIITTTKATNLKSLRSTNNVSPHPSLGHSPRTLQPKKQSYQNAKHHYAHPLSHTPSIHMHCLPITLTWTYMICTHKQSPYPPPLGHQYRRPLQHRSLRYMSLPIYKRQNVMHGWASLSTFSKAFPQNSTTFYTMYLNIATTLAKSQTSEAQLHHTPPQKKRRLHVATQFMTHLCRHAILLTASLPSPPPSDVPTLNKPNP